MKADSAVSYTTSKKDKKQAVQTLMEGIAKFETLMVLAKSEGNRQAFLAYEKSFKGLQARLKSLKENS